MHVHKVSNRVKAKTDIFTECYQECRQNEAVGASSREIVIKEKAAGAMTLLLSKKKGQKFKMKNDDVSRQDKHLLSVIGHQE